MNKILSIGLIGILVFSGVGAGAVLKTKLSLKQSNCTSEYDMVIIAPSEFSDVIQPLINHKIENNLLKHQPKCNSHNRTTTHATEPK